MLITGSLHDLKAGGSKVYDHANNTVFDIETGDQNDGALQAGHLGEYGPEAPNRNRRTGNKRTHLEEAPKGVTEESQAAVQWMARLVVTAEHEVVWSLADTNWSATAGEYARRLQMVSRTASQLSDRNVATTIVCPPAVARDGAAVEKMKSAGPLIEVKAARASRGLAVMDRSFAVVLLGKPMEETKSRLLTIQNPNVVDVLYDLLHTSADPTAPRAVHPPTASGARQRQFSTVLELMALGYKDDAAARKAGISLRTYRRHVADIMRSLGAESRFQAGVIAAGRGMIKVR